MVIYQHLSSVTRHRTAWQTQPYSTEARHRLYFSTIYNNVHDCVRHAHVAASWSGRQHSTMVAHSSPSPPRVSWCRNSRYSVAHGTEVARYSTGQ